jgi:hypothetical protein
MADNKTPNTIIGITSKAATKTIKHKNIMISI